MDHATLAGVAHEQAAWAEGYRRGKVRSGVRDDLAYGRVDTNAAQLTFGSKQQRLPVRAPDNRISPLAVGNRMGFRFREVAKKYTELAARVLGRKGDPFAIRR